MLQTPAATLDAFPTAGSAIRRAGIGTSTLLRAQDSRLSADFDQTLRSKHTLSSSRTSEQSELEAAASLDRSDALVEAAEKSESAEPDSGDAASDDAADESASPTEPGFNEVTDPQVASDGDHAAASITIDAAVQLINPSVSVDSVPATIRTINQQLLRGLTSPRVSGQVQSAGSLDAHAGAETQNRPGASANEPKQGDGAPVRAHDEVAGSAPASSPESTTDNSGELETRRRPEPAPSASCGAAETPEAANRPELVNPGSSRSSVTLDSATAGHAAGLRGTARTSEASSVAQPIADRAAAVAGTRTIAPGGGLNRHPHSGGQSSTASRASHAAGQESDAPSPFTAQLARGLSAAIARTRVSVADAGADGEGPRTHELTLRLQPAALGRVRVHVAFDAGEGKLSARFEVGSRGTREKVAESIDQLRASLQGRGLDVERMDVTVDRSLASTAPSSADPLGLLFGTPNADSPSVAHAAAHPDRAGVEPDTGGSRGGGDHEQPGPEARQEQGQGSTDAPSPPSVPSLAQLDGEGDAWNATHDPMTVGLDRIAERLAEQIAAQRPRGSDAASHESRRYAVDAVA